MLLKLDAAKRSTGNVSGPPSIACRCRQEGPIRCAPVDLRQIMF